ncbi:unnamed protein product [Arctia plantaginis]|uniref:Set2 Rpb1 interacting domain-containing protein n=1 Tax=Arctia plantaginis TaxID=874455 RepID=A0A8S0ZLC0_ARCPL|nr:unnamed protein product [Arctia plantaginis]CAB3238382.1 unnamed protein product [Arctia plantaginis]
MSTEYIQQDLIDQLLRENDDTFMALPDIGLEPHLLISKVRKHYMEYVIKLLSTNYETNQKLVNKNIYLPSAIWRCAKIIETKAAQSCMVIQLYRKNIIAVVNELKNDTKKGKLNRKLYECLNKQPPNDKKTQTACNTIKENNCQCGLNKRKRKNITSMSPKPALNETYPDLLAITDNSNGHNDNYCAPLSINTSCSSSIPKNEALPVAQIINQPNTTTTITTPPQLNYQASVESDPDELMMQLEKLFQGDQNDDDIFEGALCDKLDTTLDDHTKKVTNIIMETSKINATHDAVIENHAAQIKSLDERLASLTGLLVPSGDTTVQTQKPENQKPKKSSSSKWLCEEYFLKQKLYELLDQIGDNNRKHLEKIKEKFIYYFGYDSDDEGIISPLEETPEFIVSCKERIAPWVVKILTPYYIKGHIKGKGVFKSLAKHLIRLIYQCSKYPEEYEVCSFVSDFLKNHRTIRCEADFREFRIENI